MALGLGTGLIWEASAAVYPPLVDPMSIEELILWLDFSDATTMYTTHDSYNTNVSSDGDSIGRIKNKATIATTDLGYFAKQATATYRPTYKTGGDNGHSYGLFADGDQGLIAQSTSIATGAFGVNQLSATELDMQNHTFVIVASSTVADISADDNILSFVGHEPGDESTFRRIQIYKESSGVGGNDGFSIDYEYEGETTEDINGGIANSNTTDVSVHFFIGGTTSAGVTSAGALYGDTFKNNGGGQTAEQLANDAVMDFLPSGGGATDGYQVGGLIGTDGSFNTATTGWQGKIYEVLAYAKAINQSDRIALATYYIDKYSI